MAVCGFLVIVIFALLSIVARDPQSQASKVGENLVLHLPFDENTGSDARDWSGWGSDGTLHNFDFNQNSGWVHDEVHGWSLKFDGVDDYVEVPDSPTLRITGGITIEAWVRVSRENHDQAVVCKGLDYLLNIWGTNRPRPGVVEVGGIDPSGDEYWLPGVTPVDDNEWHHIAFTYDGSIMRVWVDGKLDAERSATFTFRATDMPVTIGSMAGTHRFLNGTIDEVRIYGRALSEGELFPKSWVDIIFEPLNLVLLALVVFSGLLAIAHRRGYWGASLHATNSLPPLKAIEGIAPFALVIACAITARFISSETLVMLVFLLALGVYIWRRYDPRILLATALFLLTASIPILAVGSEIEANEVAIWAFYFLVISILGLFIDYLKERT